MSVQHVESGVGICRCMTMSREVLSGSNLQVEQRSTIKLLHFESVCPNEIHECSQNLYGDPLCLYSMSESGVSIF